MALKLKQSLKLSQQLRMTPQLQQAIKMLQMSKLELETMIRKELNENPLLEEMIDTVEGDPGEEMKMNTGNTDSDNPVDQDPTKQDEFEWETFSDGGASLKGTSTASSHEEINYDNFISKEGDLRDHLVWQAGMSGLSEKEMDIMMSLVSYIDDNGYLSQEIDEISKDSGYSKEELNIALNLVTTFDPVGVGAKDLKDCLLIQARYLEEDTHDLVSMIEDHLEDLQTKNYKSISLKMNTSVEEVRELAEMVLTFDPKPGRAYGAGADTQYVVPDVYVRKVGDEHIVSLNEDGVPRLQISHFYRQLAHEKMAQEAKAQKESKASANSSSPAAGTQAAKDAEYLEDRLRAAMWLIKSINQRQKTIFKVTESIVKRQAEFFEKGPEHIKPMILKDIANDIEMHESTVSRVTTNKFVFTPRGVYELKYFFNSSISKNDGSDSLSSEAVKVKVKKMIAAEDPKKPLSDQKIADELKKVGLRIARRTVAKYREMLGIPPSSKRKKYY